MKKSIALLMAVFMIFALIFTSCGEKGGENSQSSGIGSSESDKISSILNRLCAVQNKKGLDKKEGKV